MEHTQGANNFLARHRLRPSSNIIVVHRARVKKTKPILSGLAESIWPIPRTTALYVVLIICLQQVNKSIEEGI
jgi:hypothetical protein